MEEKFKFIESPAEQISNIKDFIYRIISNWKWFVLSTFLALTIVFIYLRYTPNQYEAAATILIEDVENSELSAFKDLGLVGSSQASLENEIELLKSRNLIQRVAKELQLNVSYYNQGRVIEAEFFHSGSPFNINFLISDSVFDKLYTTFSILIKSKTHVILKTVLEEKEFAFGEKMNLSFGDIIITPKDIDRLKVGDETIVRIIPLRSVVERYRNKIQVNVVKSVEETKNVDENHCDQIALCPPQLCLQSLEEPRRLLMLLLWQQCNSPLLLQHVGCVIKTSTDLRV